MDSDEGSCASCHCSAGADNRLTGQMMDAWLQMTATQKSLSTQMMRIHL